MAPRGDGLPDARPRRRADRRPARDARCGIGGRPRRARSAPERARRRRRGTTSWSRSTARSSAPGRGPDAPSPAIGERSCAASCSAAGSISFSASGPHVEFVFATPDAADELQQRPRRRSTCGATLVERRGRQRRLPQGPGGDRCAACGSSARTAGVLELETQRVGRDVRARLNRLINAEEANLGRTVRAADRQLAAIARLERERDAWPRCRPALRETAALTTPHAGRRSRYACLGARRQPVGGEPSAAAARRARQRRGGVMRPTAWSPATGR